jgi:hypothetical protein
MSTVSRNDLERQVQEKLEQIPPADWVRDMIAYYHRTGTYHVRDLRRLLGDPNRAVEVGPNTSLATLLSLKDAADPDGPRGK